MEKVALITDTTADLPKEIIEKYNIKVLPFRIIYKDREYRDKVEISPEEVYNNLQVETPTSSMPALEDMEKLYEQLEEEGYTHAIAVVLSSGLSGIYNGICLASGNHPKIKSYICDSKFISYGEGVIIEECGKMLESGSTFEEIVNAIPSIKKRAHLFFVVGTLEYLKKGGRIGKVSGTIGEILNIKPIISIDSEDGKYITYDKVRGRKKSLSRMVEIIRDKFESSKCRIYVMHGESAEEGKEMKEALELLPNVVSSTFIGSISPVSGVHTGPGLVGVVCFEEI